MEKRLLTAIVLSFLILYGWSTFNKNPHVPAKNITQSIENKDVMDEGVVLNDALPTLEVDDIVEKPSEQALERLTIVETDTLLCTFSNIGGVLKSVLIKEFETTLPVSNINGILRLADYPFVLEKVEDYSISYSLMYEGVKIIKNYNLADDGFAIDSNIEIINEQDQAKILDLEISGLTLDMSSLDNGKKDASFARNKGLFEYIVYADGVSIRKNKAYKFGEKNMHQGDAVVDFLGFRNRYYCNLVKPLYENQGFNVKAVDETVLRMDTTVKNLEVQPNESISLDSFIYVGPEKIEVLKQYNLGLEKVQKYYKNGILDTIAKLIYKLLHTLHKIIPNWGVSIILVSLVIYFSMYPLTMKSMKSMKRMQALQPKIAKVKEKHKNNAQKMNQEIMELYKEHKINPMGGCLPMLFQMPVFIGLYQVLWRSVAFKGEGFLWIKDLSEPDRLFLLPTSLPVIGNEINLLPLVMMVVMFFQQKFSAKNMNSTDPSQIAQQKMMARIFPLFLGLIFYKFASGLTLYFTMFYFLSTFTQYRLSKQAGPANG